MSAARLHEPAQPPRRIAFLITSLMRAGAETQVLRLALALRTRGCDVLVISMVRPTDYVHRLEAAGAQVASLDMRKGIPRPDAVLRLVCLLRRWRPEVLACFMFHANLLGRMAGRLARVPVVVSSVRTARPGTPLQRRLLAWTDRLADATTANAAVVAAELVRQGVVSPVRIHHIPNGIDLSDPGGEPLRADVRDALGVAPGAFLWLAVGNLRPDKDYPTLLRAFARLAAESPTSWLCIAGAGPAEEDLRSLAADLGLGERLVFLGRRSDVADLLRAGDAFVMSSMYEGVPNALMEAFLARLPAVATDVGGVGELLHDGTSGYLVPPGDPSRLADAMARLTAHDAPRRRTMGEAGRRAVADACELERVVDRWQALFARLLAARRERGRWAGPEGGVT
jgi:glycosyltransferase involved in cell wall biosynthesis